MERPQTEEAGSATRQTGATSLSACSPLWLGRLLVGHPTEACGDTSANPQSSPACSMATPHLYVQE